VDPIEITKAILHNATKADEGAYVGGMLYAVFTALRKENLPESEAMVKASMLVVSTLNAALIMDQNKKVNNEKK